MFIWFIGWSIFLLLKYIFQYSLSSSFNSGKYTRFTKLFWFNWYSFSLIDSKILFSVYLKVLTVLFFSSISFQRRNIADFCIIGFFIKISFHFSAFHFLCVNNAFNKLFLWTDDISFNCFFIYFNSLLYSSNISLSIFLFLLTFGNDFISLLLFSS